MWDFKGILLMNFRKDIENRGSKKEKIMGQHVLMREISVDHDF